MINWEKITKKKTISDKTSHLHEQLEILHLFFYSNNRLIYDMINTALVSNFFAYISEVLNKVLTYDDSYLESTVIKNIKFKHLKNYNEAEVKEEVLQEFIANEFLRGIKNINCNLKNIFGFSLSENDEEWPKFVEYFKLRNEIIHKSEVNDAYLGSISKAVLENDSKKLIKMIDIFKKFKDKIDKQLVTLFSN